MKRLDPEKLNVEYRDEVTKTQPIIPRKYTLTHSDITAELFLNIGKKFAYDKITPMRDEVLAKWAKYNDKHVIYGYVHVDGQFGPIQANIRNAIFVRELPLALEGIMYGDRYFFKAHPSLYNAPIYIYFKSDYPEYNRVEYWGTPKDYL